MCCLSKTTENQGRTKAEGLDHKSTRTMSRAVTMAPKGKVETALSNGVTMQVRRCRVEMVLSLAVITILAPKCSRLEMAYSCTARKLRRQRREEGETLLLQQAL